MVGTSVPRSRFPAALALLAEVLLQPSFPEREVDRLREERVNDLMQVRAEPRRRIERVFPRDHLRRRDAVRATACGDRGDRCPGIVEPPSSSPPDSL